ncbi:hypothetical protein BKA67DRAFT_579046 [Truncatella angustata]|uniref:Uncharacterized protein n=1 Tax=Truncatella angustata TaxID=152316 RepID=A0A9P8RPR7_9PEZI|nr:uncharacterized protein BKA67DRAFT_579046 [Truncatella angustata]KAH6647958.1 hypothetical protein BKA67DRAFT_579046 [Truncatella angustata]KAH8203657.1 hypothetical protein TruAng_002187 [Truncatella angustata]
MFSNTITLKTALLATLAATAQAAAVPQSDNKAEKRGIPDNNASILTCFRLNDASCGMTASYTNGQERQTVSYGNSGTVGCAISMLNEHSNDAGFWVNVDIVGSTPGGNIGWKPNGNKIELGKATTSNEDADYITKRCQEEFTWGNGKVDTSKSGESYWNELDTKLY